MLSFVPWLLALTLSVSHASPGPGLQAVKPGTKHSKNAKRRTLQEWREEQRRSRQDKAKKEPAKAAPPQAPGAPVKPEVVPPGAAAAAEQAPPRKAETKRPKTGRGGGAPPEPWMKRHSRKIEALVALLILWLITRIYGNSSAKNARKPAPRPSPVSAEELGRTLFSVGRSDDIGAYRALFLTGTEALQVLGPDQAKQYLSRRNLAVLELAYGQITSRLPSGSSYIKTELTPMHQCILHIATADGSGRTIQVGTVAKVGAVLRLVAPMSTP